jgi:mRNA deadenylase 3'-5' endonuclease subunit Ccr4
MSNKKYDYRPNINSKSSYYEDEFEDYGYDVKNIRRQSKKKVTKFKDQNDDWGDSF